MSDLSIQAINSFPIDVYSLRHILASDALTDVQKINFIVFIYLNLRCC